MNKCKGCGIVLQTENIEKIGYTKDIEKNLCERCFRIRNYGEYKTITKTNDDFIKILKEINKTNDLVILVLDIFNLTEKIDIIKENINNDILLVITKRDILPKSIPDVKLLEYTDKYNLKTIDKIIISSNKNYNFDKLYELINKHKKSKNVYVIGFTNAGKSTMINKIIYNYSECDDQITTSILPSTTLNKIKIKINEDLNIIDTPGLITEGSIYDILDGKELKRIIPKKEIKPISYQIKGKQYIVIDKYAIMELENMNIVIYMSNALKISRYYKPIETQMEETNLEINNNDVVINGLGFIKCIGKGKIKIYTKKEITVYKRKQLI